MHWRTSGAIAADSSGRSANVRSAGTIESSLVSGTIVMSCRSDVDNQAPSLDSGSANTITPSAQLQSHECSASGRTTTHLKFQPLERLDRLAVLTP